MDINSKLELKKNLCPYITGDRAIRFGGWTKGLTKDLYFDNSEKVYNFLLQLEGKKTIYELAEENKIDIEELLELCKLLLINGVVMDNSNSLGFTEKEVNYYSRNIKLFSIIDYDCKYTNYWKFQEKLKKSKILVIGAGGTGSNTVINLSRLGIGEITVIDYDLVEYSNLNRQVYRESDVGKYKVDALREIIAEINDSVKIHTFKEKINMYTKWEKFGKDYDLLILCADKPKTIYKEIERASINYGVHWINGGYTGTTATISLQKEKSFSKLLSVMKSEQFIKINNLPYSVDNAVTSYIANFCASLISNLVILHLGEFREIQLGKVTHYDIQNFQSTESVYIIGDENE